MPVRRLVVLLVPLVVLAAASIAGGAVGVRGCGQVVLGPRGSAAFWSLNDVQAAAISCGGARELVRRWAVAAQENRLPQRVVEPEGPNHVLVYGRYGAPYRFDGFTCRWMNLPPKNTGYVPGRGSCTSQAALVTWSYRGALNPSVGKVTGCARWVNWKHGVANGLRVSGIDCASAARTVRYALNQGAVRPGRGVFEVVHRVVRGFRFTHSGSAFHARKGSAEIAFSLCWYNVDC